MDLAVAVCRTIDLFHLCTWKQKIDFPSKKDRMSLEILRRMHHCCHGAHHMHAVDESLRLQASSKLHAVLLKVILDDSATGGRGHKEDKELKQWFLAATHGSSSQSTYYTRHSYNLLKKNSRQCCINQRVGDRLAEDSYGAFAGFGEVPPSACCVVGRITGFFLAFPDAMELPTAAPLWRVLRDVGMPDLKVEAVYVGTKRFDRVEVAARSENEFYEAR